jgi:hypothetical protein
VSYSFDRYFWQPDDDPTHGIGLFFGFGATDGNPNPIQYAFIAGIGGKGVVPGRPDDSFGLGFACTQFSADFVPLLRQRLGLGLDHEDAIEATTMPRSHSGSISHWTSRSSIPASRKCSLRRRACSQPLIRQSSAGFVSASAFSKICSQD